MTSPKSTAPFKKQILELREMLPPIHPVRIVWREISDAWGTCTLKGIKRPYFEIVLHPALNANSTLRMLILAHEWAHALAWNSHSPLIEDHGPEWGLAYAKVYQHMVAI